MTCVCVAKGLLSNPEFIMNGFYLQSRAMENSIATFIMFTKKGEFYAKVIWLHLPANGFTWLNSNGHLMMDITKRHYKTSYEIPPMD